MNKIIRSFEVVVEFFKWILVNPFLLVISNRTDFFSYNRLVRLKFVRNPFELGENSYYGHRRILKKLGLRSYGSRLEHGVFFAHDEGDLQSVLSPFKRLLYRIKHVYTYSDLRKDFIESYIQKHNLQISVKALGPYILYADHFYSKEDLNKLKSRLGRVLLVYPQHSIERVSHDFDIDELLKEIERRAKDFDTVLVSLYWADVARGCAKQYKEAGFRCVTSGRREDPNFLSRQKDLIWLSDMILTNTLGTHMGYAIAMNRPCVMIRQKIKNILSNKLSKQSRAIETSALARKEEISRVFYDAFSKDSTVISAEQKYLVRKYWGANGIM